MRRVFLSIATAIICVLCFGAAEAQSASTSNREAVWNSYPLPTADFVRQTDEANAVSFRVPETWKMQEAPGTGEQRSSFKFSGPYSTLLQISIERISDGLPLPDYVAAIVQQLRNLPGSADSLTVRRTEMSGLEAREILFEIPDANGELSRRLIWCAVSGPVAVGVVLIEPETHSAEIEPYLRAVVQSLTISEKERFPQFVALRTAAIKESKPARVDEVQSIAAKVNGLDISERETATAKLSQVFTTAPDAAIDLLLDRRPLIRAAAIQAIARSQNHTLDPFLLTGLHDPELFVAARAARAIGTIANAISLMRDETLNWQSTETLARAWPFLDRKLQVQILNEVFAPSPGSQPTRRIQSARNVRIESSDPSSQLGLITLLVDIPVQDFKLPLTEVLKARTDVLTVATLQVGYARGESLPPAELVKLLSSTNSEVRRLAALNLGESATPALLSQLEESVKQTTQPGDPLAAELRTAIRKIRLREQLGNASKEQRQQLIDGALADPQLADWAFRQYVRDSNRSVVPRAMGQAFGPLSPYGENVFPKRMMQYVAIPNPADAFHKFGESLKNIQMDSARAQANMVLLLNGIQRRLGLLLGAPFDGPISEYSGISTAAPIASGVWTAAGAPPGTSSAQHKAIILRVGDRDRFERILVLYQESMGSLSLLPEGASIVTRFMGALPAILPMSADVILRDRSQEKKESTILKYGLQGQTEVDGYPVKWFAARRVSGQGIITNDVAYLAYVGDAALLTPDIYSMLEALQRVRGGGSALAESAEFKAALAAGGDAIYFSNLAEMFSQPGEKNAAKINETGALKISNNSWESSYHLSFDDTAWSKPLLNFQPDQLSAPRDLLPRSTVLYYFMKVNGAEAVKEWGKAIGTEEAKGLASAWGLELNTVVSEFDSECGAAVLNLPDLAGSGWSAPWVIFFKLKSDLLQRAFAEGRLFKEPARSGVVKIKLGASELFVTVRNGFLVVADQPATVELLSQKEKLVASPDFGKAVKRTPTNIVAFGGYNLEATSIQSDASPDAVKTQTANMYLSLVRAFHSPSLYATINAGGVDARSSVSMDREGRYSVAELQALAVNSEPTFAVIEPTGIPIANQARIKSLRLRLRAPAAGEVDRIAADLASTSQTVEQRSDKDLVLQVLPRRVEPKQPVTLPVTAGEFAYFLSPTKDIRSDDQGVRAKAREIAGADRDAWSVARKLANWTYENLTWKRVDYADAAQTLATREADCYEFSKLYVAMARSLGLPARVVSGMAYSGRAFGGHAWVEVYAGSWIEIDPTWGTTFVDATHLKDPTGALLTYAALNLLQLEVLDAPRAVADFQSSPAALMSQLCAELPKGETEALKSAFDMATVTDELMGAGSWAAMSDHERDQMSGAYERIVNDITLSLKTEGKFNNGLRQLKINISGDRAEALLMHSQFFQEMLVRINLIRRSNAWFVVEITQVDSYLKVISESLKPSINQILQQRRNDKSHQTNATDFARVLITLDRNPQAALQLAERLLKNNPTDRGLRFLKSMALDHTRKKDEAVKLWEELSAEQPPMAVALRHLAEYYENSEIKASRKKAIDLNERYVSVEPDDPRAHSSLASLYEDAGDFAKAEIEYRAAVSLDSSNSLVFLDLAQFYATRKRFDESVAVLDDARKRTADEDDLFATLISRFWSSEQAEVAEGLAASQPQRMATSAAANLSLGRVRLSNARAREALPLLKRAAILDRKSSDAYDAIASAYRQLHEWVAALNAADTAIRLAKDDSEAHYQRACALARLGRKTEALAALKRGIELDEDMIDSLAEEEDLKTLVTLPEFKKLLPKQEQP